MIKPDVIARGYPKIVIPDVVGKSVLGKRFEFLNSSSRIAVWEPRIKYETGFAGITKTIVKQTLKEHIDFYKAEQYYIVNPKYHLTKIASSLSASQTLSARGQSRIREKEVRRI